MLTVADEEPSKGQLEALDEEEESLERRFAEQVYQAREQGDGA